MTHALAMIGLFVLLPTTAAAQAFSGDMRAVIQAVAGPWIGGVACDGPSCTLVLGMAIMNAVKPLVGVVAIFIIVRAGFVLVYRGSEEEFARAKRSIASALTAIILFFLAPRLVDIFYGGIQFGGPGTALSNPGTHVGVLSTELLGFVRWITVLVAVGAVAVLIISGFRTIISFGNEQGTSQLKETIIGVIAGIALLIFANAIMSTLGLQGGPPTPVPVILRTVQVINQLLLLAAIIAVAIVVYAGITMILFVGDEEKFGAAKNLIIRSLTGLAVILVSYLLMLLVVSLMGG